MAMFFQNTLGSNDADTERLRRKLLDEIYAGAFAGGMPAMLSDESRIRNASAEELKEIARQYGY